MFMSFSPILSNSFIKCAFIIFVFSLNRPVSASWSKPFIAIPIISIFYATSLILVPTCLHSLYYNLQSDLFIIIRYSLIFVTTNSLMRIYLKLNQYKLNKLQITQLQALTQQYYSYHIQQSQINLEVDLSKSSLESQCLGRTCLTKAIFNSLRKLLIA